MPIRIPGQAGDPDFLFPCAPALYFPRRVWYNNNSRKYEGGGGMFSRIYLEITNCCNLSCAFCPGTRRARRMLPAEEFRLLAGKLRPWTDYLYLHVLGEPLLHPQLAEILASAGELGFRVCLVTNGTLLAQRLDTLLAAPALHKLSVSLHSFEANDAPMPLETYLAAVWDGCARLAERGVLCALRLWNEGGLEEKNAEILRYLERRCGRRIADIPADRRRNRTLRPNLFLEHAEKFDWPAPGAPLRRVEFCHGLRRQLAVLCDGTVVPCCLDGEGELALGNLFRQELEDILRGERATAIHAGFDARRPAEALCRRCGYAERFTRG